MKTPAVLAIILSSITFTSFSSAEISTTANVSLTSDYVWRGVSQTLEDPAIQGGFDIETDNGFSLGVWGSNVDFGEGDSADLELDLYGSWGFALNDDWSASLGFIRYIYPGTAAGVDYDWSEFSVGLSYDTYSFSANHSNDVFGSSEPGTYLDLSGEWALNDDSSLRALVGHYDLSDLAAASITSAKNYSFVNLGVDYSLDKIVLSLDFYGTNNRSEELWGKIGENRTVFTISSSF